MAEERAILAGGCFWCTEAVFKDLVGVSAVESGYIGGHVDSPTYRQVCGGDTGHAEAIRVTYDPEQISYDDLLDIFFTIHDPTTKDRQGNDVGPQYRSAIFTHSDAQRTAAYARLKAAQSHLDATIVTEISPLEKFWPAEAYHDNYFARNPGNPYCAVVVAPKVAKARKIFFEKLARV